MREVAAKRGSVEYSAPLGPGPHLNPLLVLLH